MSPDYNYDRESVDAKRKLAKLTERSRSLAPVAGSAPVKKQKHPHCCYCAHFERPCRCRLRDAYAASMSRGGYIGCVFKARVPNEKAHARGDDHE